MSDLREPREAVRPLVVAIDGPAGTGKSTVARGLAERLGLGYLDTGAMYRAVTLAAQNAGWDPQDPKRVSDLTTLAQGIDLLIGDGVVAVDGADVTLGIRTAAVDAAVSAVAAIPAVRANLVQRQRDWASARGGAVLEGRDIATVVFPDAVLKVYLVADPSVRAARRALDQAAAARDIEADLVRRDHADSSQLRQAKEATVIDTSALTPVEIVDLLEELFAARCPEYVPAGTSEWLINRA